MNLNDQQFPTPMTEADNLRRMMRSLSPVQPDRPLVRVGPQGDGGYLVPDDLDGILACFSPGVAEVSGFELACAEKGMAVYMADPSVEAPAGSHPAFHFTRKFIGATKTRHFLSMEHWVEQSLGPADGDLLLQMDIEGYEYETLFAMPDALLRRFRIIVVEFHHLHHFYSQPYFRLASRVFDRLLGQHACVHIHPNNCATAVYRQGLSIPRVMEFTFYRRDRLTSTTPATTFPHPLDTDNTTNSTLILPDCWYRRD